MDLLNEILKSDLPVPQSANANTSLAVIDATPNVAHLANNTISDDAQESRNNIRKLVAQGAGAINDLMITAKATNSPRAYEVLANLLKTVSELNHDLMDVHAKEQSLTEPVDDSPNSVHNHIEKAVFVGSTSELSQMMKEQHDNESCTTVSKKEPKEIGNI